MKNPLYYWSKSHFSGQSFAENLPIKKTLHRSQQNLAIVNQHHPPVHHPPDAHYY
jgi:hypothetical protein